MTHRKVFDKTHRETSTCPYININNVWIECQITEPYHLPACMRSKPSVIDPLEGQSVTHKLIYFELLVHILFHQFGNMVNTLIA